MQCPFLSAHEHLCFFCEHRIVKCKTAQENCSLNIQACCIKVPCSDQVPATLETSYAFSVLNSMWQVKGYCLDSASMGLTRSQKAWRMPQQCCFRRHLGKGQVCAPAHRHFWWDVPLDCPKRHGNLISSSPPNPIP